MIVADLFAVQCAATEPGNEVSSKLQSDGPSGDRKSSSAHRLFGRRNKTVFKTGSRTFLPLSERAPPAEKEKPLVTGILNHARCGIPGMYCADFEFDGARAEVFFEVFLLRDSKDKEQVRVRCFDYLRDEKSSWPKTARMVSVPWEVIFAKQVPSFRYYTLQSRVTALFLIDLLRAVFADEEKLNAPYASVAA